MQQVRKQFKKNTKPLDLDHIIEVEDGSLLTLEQNLRVWA
jgi:hypothetical protein